MTTLVSSILKMEALKCLKVCQNHNMTKITTLVSSILKMEALKCLKVCQNHNMTKIKDKKLKLKKKKKTFYLFIMFIYLSLPKTRRHGIFNSKVNHVQGSHTQDKRNPLLYYGIKAGTVTSHYTSNHIICNLCCCDVQNTLSKIKRKNIELYKYEAIIK